MGHASLVLCLLAFMIAVVFAGGRTTGRSSSSPLSSPAFRNFRSRFNRTYQSPEHLAHAAVNYNRNLQAARELSNRNPHARFGETLFSDYSASEFIQAFAQPSWANPSGPPPHGLEYKPNPDHEGQHPKRAEPPPRDWCDEGFCTPVKNHHVPRYCGCCWCAVTAEMVETAWAIAGRQLTEMSMQAILDCTPKSFGCSGGWEIEGLNWVITAGGLASASAYPYQAVQRQCRYDPATRAGGIQKTVQYQWKMELENTVFLDHVANKGPLTSPIVAGVLQNYQGGIITAGACATTNGIAMTNHVVVIVGYGTENGIPYWRMRNSWGAGWGEGGYFRIQRGINLCGVAQDVVGAVGGDVGGPPPPTPPTIGGRPPISPPPAVQGEISIPTPLKYFPLPAPWRCVDTRTEDMYMVDKGKLRASEYRQYRVSQVTEIYPELGNVAVVAMAGGIQAVEADAPGYMTVWPASAQKPTTSSVNFQPGLYIFASLYCGLSSMGVLNVYSQSPVHLLIDVTGVFGYSPDPKAGLWFHPLTPVRMFDTRSDGQGPITRGVVREYQMAGAQTIPSSARAVSYGAALPEAVAANWFSIWPQGDWPGTTAGLTNAGIIEQTAGIATLGSDGKIRLLSGTPVHVALDVDGYFDPPGASAGELGFVPLKSPIRVYDSRDTPSGWHGAGAEQPVDCSSVLPASAQVAVVTATAVNGDPGYVTIWPAGLPRPLSSALQFNSPKQDVMALALNLPISTSLSFVLFSPARGDVVVDVIGYYMSAAAPVVVRAEVGAEWNYQQRSSSAQHVSSGVGVVILIVCAVVLAAVVLVAALVIARRRTGQLGSQVYQNFIVQ